MAGEFPDSEEEGLAQASLAQAGDALHGRRPDIPAGFVVHLYEHAVPEDVVRYDPVELAALAERAFDFLSVRTPGTPKVRCETVRLHERGEHKQVTVVEVVNDDMPFLVDSVMGELAERKLEVYLAAHPVFGVRREGDKLVAAGGADAPNHARESFIHVHIETVTDPAVCAELSRALELVLKEVRLAVQDWRPMLERVNAIVAGIKTNPPPLPVDEIAEAIQFLQWLAADNFTFLGVRNYLFDGHELVPDYDSALGIMRNRDLLVLKRGDEHLEFTPEIMAFLMEPRPLIIAKANIHARVHRRAYLDYIGVKHFDADGNLLGEQRFVGLFTSTAYTRSAHGIPYLRRKLASIERRAGFAANSHSGKALANVLEHYPRDELFQVDEDTLYRFAMTILHLDEHPRVRVLARRDRFDRFVSVLVYAPRDRYGSAVRVKIGAYLAQAFIGRVSAFYPFFPEGPLVRVHFIIGRSGGPTPEVARATLEREIETIIRTWTDGLHESLELSHPPETARALFKCYCGAFSEGFHEAYPPAVAAVDVETMEGLSAERPLGVDFRHRQEEDQRTAGLKVWSLERPLPLSERVPVLENMGFKVVDERTYHIAPQGGRSIWFHDMLLERSDGEAIDLQATQGPLEATFLMVMRGAAENDGYNALTLVGGMTWRDVALIRTLSRYLRQVRLPFSQDYMWTTLDQTRRDSPRDRRFVPRALRPACRSRKKPRRHAAGNRCAHRGGAAGGRKPGRRPHPASLPQCGAVGDAHKFLSGRRRRAAKAADRRQVRERQAHHHAAAAPALRDLRLFAAGGRHPSAFRQSRARRYPLVRPAAGLPHRGSWAGEGAAGQERGDRAGRRQGRLRAQADAERRSPRRGAGRRRRHLQAIHLDAARPHRQYRCRRRRRAA